MSGNLSFFSEPRSYNRQLAPAPDPLAPARIQNIDDEIDRTRFGRSRLPPALGNATESFGRFKLEFKLEFKLRDLADI